MLLLSSKNKHALDLFVNETNIKIKKLIYYLNLESLIVLIMRRTYIISLVF